MAQKRQRCPSTIKPITLAIIASLTSLALAAPPAPTELPSGGNVAAGSAAISQSAANLTINQSSSRAIINWNTFNIGAQASVAFNQPSASSVTLNRVLASDPSAIYGRLSANGQIFLVNPAGIVFGAGSSVNTAGIVASTLNISDQNFMSGNYRFERNGSTGAILNQGTLTSNGGYVALLAPEVRNEGVILANLGTVALAAGEAVTLTFDAANQLRVAVDPSTLKTLIENRHIIQADGGTVLMASSAAADVLGSVIRNTGVIEANSIGSINGEVVLYAANGTTLLEGSGRIEARGLQDGQTGGTVKLLGNQVGMFDSSSIDVSGAAGGGTVLVGGNFHGAGPEANASATYIAAGASINADATVSGNGGNVALWADNATGFYGNISAQGGAQGGNGGFVETSGKQFLDYQGLVNTMAPQGNAGTLLLDPTDITISTAPSTGTMLFNGITFTYADTITTPSNLNAANLVTQLGLSNVTVSTASGLAGNGDISVNASVAYTSANSLTLTANRNINVNSNVTNSGTGTINLNATGNLLLQSSTVSTSGAMTINASGLSLTANTASAQLVSTGTQSITVGSGGLTLTGAGGAAASGSALISQSGSTGTQTITVNGGGNITLNGGAGSGNNNFARILANGTAQNIAFSAGGKLTLTGGTVGNLNFAEISANNATLGAQTQSITGATGITMTGGASGGGVDAANNELGNRARIVIGRGSQNISVGAGGITMTGGGGSLADNNALILQGTSVNGLSVQSAGTSQTITIGNGGTITLTGGSTAQTNVIGGTGNPGNLSRGSYALIEGRGDAQLINFTSGGAITLTGGTVGSNNFANITSQFGTQTITGAPAITVTGGASGGTSTEGNGALIQANVGKQSITAGAIALSGGAAGIGNSGGIRAPLQTISASTVTLNGGGSTPNGGARIGGIGGDPGSVTNLTLTTTGDITLNGGSGGFAAIGAGGTTTVAVNVNVTINGGGNITLNGGSGSEALIGSDGSPLQAGNLSITAAGNIALNNGNGRGGSIRTQGNLTLQAGQSISEQSAGIITVGGNLTLNSGGITNILGAANAGGTLSLAASTIAGSGSLQSGGAASFMFHQPAGATGVTILFPSLSVNAPAGFYGFSGASLVPGGIALSDPGIIIAFGAADNSLQANQVANVVANPVATTDGGLDRTGLQAPSNAINVPVSADLTGATDPVLISGELRVGSVTSDKESGEARVNSPITDTGAGASLLRFAEEESVRRNARNARYKSSIEILRTTPTAADIPLCGPSASEMCMPTKPGIVTDVALGPVNLKIPATDVRKKIAILIGNNDYRGDIPRLETPVSDVAAIGRVLQDRLGYEVTLVPNATKATMVRILKSLSEQSSQDESVLVFYAGHGYQLEDSKAGFWIPTDADADDPTTWLSNNDVQRFLNRIDAKQIVVVSDSCFSGTLTKEQSVDAPRNAIREQLLSRRAVVTMSSGGEEPVSDEGVGRHSIFAHHFMDEMQKIQKMSPVSAAFERLREKVAKTYPQTPQLGAVVSAGHMTGANYLFEVK